MDRRASVRARSNSVVTGVTTTGPNGTGTNGTGGGTGTRTRHKSGNASYADLITRAIMSSDEKRLTLSEIYDWMVDNVDGLRDQRYLHSAKGWKNAVRHTLSINPRFQKVARLGRPGWWTVDADYAHRSTSTSTTAQAPCAASFATATLIWDTQGNMHAATPQAQAAFRGRLSSAPALFLSPIFATPSGTLSAGCFSPLTAASSRPPSVMSMRSSGRSSTSIASPTSETASSICSVVSPIQHNGITDTTQTVHVWQDGGVGLVSVPRPLPMRVADVSEMATQTDDATASVACPPFTSVDPAMNYPYGEFTTGSMMDSNTRDTGMSFPRIRNMCDYFENVSPVSSPLASNSINSTATMQRHHLQQEQTPVLDQYQNDRDVHMSLVQSTDGSPMLILTRMMPNQNVVNTGTIIHPASSSGHQGQGPCKNVPGSRTNGSCTSVLTSHARTEDLPEDLEGVDVDPNVRCDVVAVMKYEENFYRIPKMEPA